MNQLLRKLLANRGLYMEPAGEDGSPGGGGKSAEELAADEAAARAADDAAATAEAARLEAEKAGKGKKPTDEEARLLKEVMKKKEALEKATKDLGDVQTRLKEFEGLDPAEVRELIKAKKDAETLKLEAAGEYERVKQQMVEEHKKDKKALADNLAISQTQIGELQSVIGELTVGNAFANSVFVKNDLAAPSKARANFGAHFEFKDGSVIGYDKPAGQANRTPLVDGEGNPLSFEDALKKIVDADPAKDELLKSKLVPGAGSNKRPQQNNTNNRGVPPSNLSGRERIAAALSSKK